MDYINYLQDQQERKDDIGWFARLVFSISETETEIRKYAGISPLQTFAETFGPGKIKHAFLHSINEWLEKLAIASPRIGIFWLYKNDIHDFSMDSRTLPVQAGFKDAPFTHWEEWDKMTSLYPELKTKEYDEVPRGRVIGIGPDRYRIFLSGKDASNSSLVSTIMRYFGLPASRTEVMQDEHYETIN